MESVIQTLTNISKSARLVSTEQVLMSNVSLLDDFLNETLSEDQIESIETVLLSLFSVNKSEFSAQCSLYIASKIVYLYKLKKNPQLFDVINFALTNPSVSTFFCVGYICKYIGSKSKAQLPHFVDFLLKQKIELGIASLYALRCCFKASCGSLDSYLHSAFDYAKKLVYSNANLLLVNTNLDPFHQSLINMSIKLVKELAKIENAPVSEFLDFAKQLYSSFKYPLLHEDIANLVARCACIPIYPKISTKKKEKAEFSISNYQDTSNELNESLEIIKNFGKLTNSVLRHFFNILTPTLVARCSVPLFRFLRENCPQLLPVLIPILPIDTKFNLFTEVAHESNVNSEQLQLLILLCPDSNSINEAASVALLLASSNDKVAQNSANEFFASFSKTHPVVTLSYLRTSLVFLAHPPELDRDIEKELHGNACIATTILENIPRIEDAMIHNKETIVDYINDVFTEKNTSSVRFADAFKFLSILDSLPVKESLVSDAVIAAVDFLMSSNNHDKKWRLLLKNVLHFRTKFIDIAQNNLLVVAALSTTKSSDLSRSILIDLEKLVPLSSNIEGWASETVKRVVESAKSIQLKQDLIKKFILRPLPIGNDLLKSKNLGMRKEKKGQDNLESMITNFPPLFDTCSLNEKTALIKSLVNDKKPVSYLFVLQLFRTFPQKMPKRAYTVLLKKMNDKNLTTLEILADTIAVYYDYDKTTMPAIFNFIEEASKKGTNIHGSCILLSALFSHSQVQHNYISRAIILLNSFMKMGSSVPFAMHAINSMFIRHPMEITSLGIAMNEFSVLFETLNQQISLQPVVLHLCSELFSFLVEINSSNIKAVEKFVKISLEAVKYTPIDYAKEAYLNCAKSIIIFAQSMTKYIQIQFPSSICTTIPTELAACSAFSDLLKFEKKIVDLKLPKSVQIALNLLHGTGDDRASSFIVALASSDPDLEFWISLIRRILLVNSVFNSSSSKIEPNQIIKVTFLEVASIILPYLAAEIDLKTEYLDDIISAICQAIGTERVIIQEAAFPVLNKLINLFRDRISENGGRLLDLYDVQFVSAVKIGFTLNLSTSGEFLSTYLSFRMQVVNEDTSNQEILDVYVPGLQNCRQRTSSYFSLVLDLCIVARRFESIANLIKPFLKKVVPIFATIVVRSMKIKQNDWRKMSKFRSLVSSFYENLPSNFVWLQHLTNNEQIDVNVLLSFFICDLKVKNSENWKINGALNAIPVCFHYFGEKIKPELINETIQLISNFQKSNIIIDILKMASRLLKENDKNEELDDIRMNILSLAMKIDFFIPEVFAHVLYKDKLFKLRDYSVAIGAHFVIQIQKGFDAEKLVPLFKILFDHSPKVIGIILTVILTKLDSKFDQIKVQIVTIALSSKNVDHIPLNLIGRFAVQSFEKPTGIQMISTILLKNPEVGIAILSQNVAKVSFLLAANDLDNCRDNLRFIHLCLDIMFDNADKIDSIDLVVTKFALSTVELIFDVIKKFGNDPQKGPHIVMECIIILRLIRDKRKKELCELFESKEKAEIEELVSMIQKHITKAILRSKNSNLTIFSNNARTNKFDDWQSLTSDESSDGN